MDRRERRALAQTLSQGPLPSELAEIPGAHVDRALFDVVERGGAARAVLDALRLLERRGGGWRDAAVRLAVGSRLPSVRAAALRSGAPIALEALERVACLEPSHAVRLAALSRPPSIALARLFASDPHWRVRAALVDRLSAEAPDVELGADARSEGVRAFLEDRAPAPAPDATLPELWDDDPAVLGRRVVAEGLSSADASALVAHEDRRVRRAATRELLRRGSVGELAAVFRQDPREAGLFEELEYLDARLDEDRRVAAYSEALGSLPAEPWGAILRALWHVGVDAARPWRHSESALVRAAAVRAEWAAEALDDPDERVRVAAIARLSPGEAAARVAARWGDLRSRLAWVRAHECAWERGLYDPDGAVRAAALEAALHADRDLDLRRFREDEDHRVRAVALGHLGDVARAQADDAPRVWAAVAIAAGVPPSDIAGAPSEPERPARPAPSSRISGPTPSPSPRSELGATGLRVSRLGVSGHYGLERDGFALALASDINFFFWEPSYGPQTSLFRALAPSLREELVVAAGSFAASPDEIRADLDRALSATRLGRVDLFLVFWVRSWGRLSDDVTAALDAAAARGDLGAWGFSTHRRAIAREALERGVEPVMVRHNAAHRGAEDEVFPAAATRRAGLITFSNLLYGRLLTPIDGYAPSAADCYAYSLAQPAVTATLTAPSTETELRHNLEALSRQLDPEMLERLRAHGDRVYRRERRFRRCIRER